MDIFRNSIYFLERYFINGVIKQIIVPRNKDRYPHYVKPHLNLHAIAIKTDNHMKTIVFAAKRCFIKPKRTSDNNNWTASSEFGTYCLCEQRRFRRACAFAQSRQNPRCSLIQAVSQEEPSDKKPDPWPL